MRWWLDRDGTRVEVAVRRLDGTWEVTLDGTPYRVEMLPLHAGLDALFCPDGRSFGVASQRLGRDHYRVAVAQRQFEVRLRDPLDREANGAAVHTGPHELRAPIPGRVVSLAVALGDEVQAGQPLVILEAMKMENQICAEGPGHVERILVTPGATVEGGQILVVVG